MACVVSCDRESNSEWHVGVNSQSVEVVGLTLENIGAFQIYASFALDLLINSHKMPSSSNVAFKGSCKIVSLPTCVLTLLGRLHDGHIPSSSPWWILTSMLNLFPSKGAGGSESRLVGIQSQSERQENSNELFTVLFPKSLRHSIWLIGMFVKEAMAHCRDFRIPMMSWI